MTEKLLVQSQGSEKDPKYTEQMLMLDGKEMPFHAFFHKQGIKTLDDDLINSCHGNTGLTLGLAKDVQKLADAGNRIVALEQGGLYFAKPSLEAANMPTVPVISVPLGEGLGGLAAFLAPYVPPGTAAIAGVANGDYQAAANVAVKILTKEFKGVYLADSSERLEKTLEKLHVPILGELSDVGFYIEDALVVGSVPFDFFPTGHIISLIDMGPGGSGNRNNLVVFAPLESSGYTQMGSRLQEFCAQLKHSVLVNREENIAYFAAKVMAAYNPEIAAQLKADAKKKEDSYAKREVTIDSFTLGGK